MFCGPCLLECFNERSARSCPECRSDCRHEPKREFVIQGVLSLIFQAHGREVPTPASEGFNTNAFAHVWAREREERRNRRLQAQQHQLVDGVGDIGHIEPILIEEDNGEEVIQMVVDDGSDWASQAGDGDEESEEEL